MKNCFFKVFLLSISFVFSNQINAQSKSKFKIVLDAGHGGKDYGTVYHGNIEKKIALSTTLKVGDLLDKDTEIEIVYSRKTDVFVELKDRANNANKADADLFVSIHCNGVKSFGPYGTETFVMGLTRSTTNLDVAKNENSVILLEKDYKEKYNGFDPNKPETLIGLKILQEEYLNQSIDLAAKVQENFTNTLNRKDRGVKQAPLWVLDASYMPSVLIEIGFISNVDEGNFLNSDEGQDKVAKAIADAILAYKKEYFNPSSTPNVNIEVKNDEVKPINENKPVVKTVSTKGIVFKVQISASGTKLDTSASNFKGLNDVSIEQSGKLYKYFYGNENSYDQAKLRLADAKEKGYNSAFLVAYKDGLKISISEAIK
ncbi:N-acetylmuramoyl-L-alanine amidase [Flavobacterium sp.]|uniref:N-acetylmuramoyl-L-alanine amidase family protein n=1 Tax=Flavobacterium sp. TaxID=239 RepID=UPI002A8034F3|nr:N-acetylmuramoyl-L-alanine amidase [Flavobacterium sp.]